MDLSKFDPLQLNETDFILNPDAQNVCFLPPPIFTRISEMLSPSDFYNLAQTCRYMHWRMFTYGHLMLKHHLVRIDHYEKESKIEEAATIEGRYWKDCEIIVTHPYVYFKYLLLKFDLDSYSSSMFDRMIDYVNKAKKRTKYYCIIIVSFKHVCTQQTFEDINNLIEKLNPFQLEITMLWGDHKLTVEIPSIKNVYSIFLENCKLSQETELHMNPCAEYRVRAAQNIRDIVQEFTKSSRLQRHICKMFFLRGCRALLEKEWKLKFKEADETLKSRFRPSQSDYIPLYASIPSEHGDIEIFIMEKCVVIQRK